MADIEVYEGTQPTLLLELNQEGSGADFDLSAYTVLRFYVDGLEGLASPLLSLGAGLTVEAPASAGVLRVALPAAATGTEGDYRWRLEGWTADLRPQRLEGGRFTVLP